MCLMRFFLKRKRKKKKRSNIIKEVRYGEGTKY